MKKGMLHTILALALVLMLALTPAFSLAEGAQFGELTGRLMGQAWEDGRQINARLSLNLDEFTTGDMGEDEQQIMDAAGQLLDIAALNVAVTPLENGVRLDANAELSEQKIVTGALEITPEIIAAETNILPGKRLVVSVEDVKALLSENGTLVSEEEISAAIEQLSAYLLEAAMRYGTVISDWASQIEVIEGAGTDATDTCDAISGTCTYVVTGKQIKALLVGLIDAAMEDEMLISFIEAMNEDEEIDAQDALAEARAEIEEDTELDAFKLSLALGLNENDELVAMAVRLTQDASDSFVLAEIQGKTYENGEQKMTFAMRASDGETDLMTYEYTVVLGTNEAGDQTTDMAGTMTMNDGYVNASADIDMQGVVAIADSSESSTVNENVRMVIEYGDGESYGRNNMDLQGTAVISTEDLGGDFKTLISADCNLEGNVEAPVAMRCGVELLLTSGAYVPSAETLTDVDVLSLDEEGLSALESEMETGLMQVAFSALSLLPQDLLAVLMAE